MIYSNGLAYLCPRLRLFPDAATELDEDGRDDYSPLDAVEFPFNVPIIAMWALGLLQLPQIIGLVSWRLIFRAHCLFAGGIPIDSWKFDVLRLACLQLMQHFELYCVLCRGNLAPTSHCHWPG
jgi:hypothetical protein